MSTTFYDAFEAGKLLATVDGSEYRLVSIVCVRASDGALAVYCKADDWKTTPVALLAKRDAEIEALKRRVEELETERNDWQMRALVEKSEPITVEEAVSMTAPTQNGALFCPECHKEFLSFLGITGHAWKKHGLKLTREDLGLRKKSAN